MTFADLAAYCATTLAVDGDSSPPVPKVAPYYSTAWGIRLGILLRRFTRDTLLLYTPMATITVASGVQVLDMTDSAVSAKAFFDVHKIWLNNVLIEKFTGAEQIVNRMMPGDPTGTPAAFAQLDSQNIIFDLTTSDDIDNCYASGFYRHPAISSDATAILGVIEDYLDLFSRYAQAYYREDVAADDVGMGRLQRIDRQAFEAVEKLRSERMYNMMAVTRGC